MPSLANCFNRVFLFGLELEERLLEGTPPCSCEQAQQTAMAHLEAAGEAATQAGKAPADIAAACRVVAAWIDALTGRHSDWSAGTTSLLSHLFGIEESGAAFLARCRGLDTASEEMRAIYRLALCLDSGGRNGDGREPAPAGAPTTDVPSGHTPSPRLTPASSVAQYLTPQPYLSADPGPPRLPQHWDRLIWRSALVLAVLGPLAVLIDSYRHPSSVHPRVTPPPVAPVPVDRTVALDHAALSDVRLHYRCARIEYVADDSAGHVIWRGHVAETADRERLRQETAKIPGVRSFDIDVQLRIWPYCELIEFLEPYRRNNLDRQMGLVMLLNNHSLKFREGEQLILNIVAPNYDAHIYVDYYQRDGNVVHMHPSPAVHGNPVSRDRQLIIGELAPGFEGWIVQPPFGEEMLTIIASPHPLFPERRPEIETARDYLIALLRSIEKTRSLTDRVVADYFFIETQP